jgi:hypothetical protein
MAEKLTLLGFAPAEGAAALAARLAALPGPGLRLVTLGGIAAFAQETAPPLKALLLARDRASLLAALATLQRRLEAACMAGPFLPADPGAATLTAAELPALLAAQQAALTAALARHGATQQWDVILRWPPEPVLAAQRERFAGLGRAALAEAVAAALAEARAFRLGALRAALRDVVLEIAEASPVAEDAAAGLTLLVPSGGEAVIEAALGRLPPEATAGASADLRGPLPPLGFAAVRLAEVPAGAVERAWHLLGLPEALPSEDLTRHWRGLATRLHPDRAGPAADPARFAEAAAAYRLVRSLAGSGAGEVQRATLAARAGRHLLLPEAA